MKIITLAVPAWFEDLRRSVSPQEGSQLVSDEKAAELAHHGLLSAKPEDEPEELVLAKPKRGA